MRQGGTAQQLFFGPLLEARRRAADARTPAARVRAFGARELAAALDRAIERIVNEWPDPRPPVRRALRAELLDRVQPYSRALAAMATHASVLLDSATEDLTAWRTWTGSLTLVFSAADRAWIGIRHVVESLPRPGSARDSGRVT